MVETPPLTNADDDTGTETGTGDESETFTMQFAVEL